MLKVLNIISDTNIGGAGRSVLNYLKYADLSEFEPMVLLPKGSLLTKMIKETGTPVYEVDAMADRSLDLPGIKKLASVIEKLDPDIVHTHGSLSGRIAAKRCKKPVVFTRHSAFPFPEYITKTPLKLIYKFLYEHYSDRIVVISPAGAQVLMEGGVSEKKIDIMMNGVDKVQRLSPEDTKKIKAELGIDESDFVLGILARIEDYKGHLDILEAVKLLSDSGKKVKLIIAGTGSFEDTVKKRAGELGINEHVIFTGFVKDTARILSAMDLQLNASYISETSSLAILEGMSIGLPAVVSDCCGNPYMVDDNVSGLLFKPQDSADMAEKISRAMEEKGLLKRLGEGALEAYEQRFTGRRFSADIEAIYRKAASEERRVLS